MTEEVVTPVTEVAEPVQEPSQPAEVKQEDAPVEKTEEGPSKTPEQEKFERRIARQTAANREQQRQLEEARKRIAELEQSIPKKDPLADRPNPDNFDSHDDYVEALSDWKLNQKLQEHTQKAQEQKTVEEQVKQKLEFERKAIDFKSKEDAFRAKYPSYEKSSEMVNNVMKLANPEDPSFKAFADTILGAENAPALIHHLGNNPNEMFALFGKTPFEVQDHLETIIEKIGEKPTRSESRPKANLPEPPEPVNGESRVKKDVSQMSGTELLKHMEGLNKAWK